MEYIHWETEAAPWNELLSPIHGVDGGKFCFLIIPYVFCPLNLFRTIIFHKTNHISSKQVISH